MILLIILMLASLVFTARFIWQVGKLKRVVLSARQIQLIALYATMIIFLNIADTGLNIAPETAWLLGNQLFKLGFIILCVFLIRD